MKISLDDLLNNTADIALRRRAVWLLKTLNLARGERILDLGCGDGFYLHLLVNLDLNLKLFGLDNDRNALKSARKNLNSEKVRLIKSDLMKKLPFPSNYFDGVIMSEVIEHLPNDIFSLKEVRRVLKDNGKLVLSVPHIGYPFLWDPVSWILQRILKTHVKRGFWAGIWNQHLRLYSNENLRHVLKEGGFKNVKIAKLTHFCFPFNHHIINLGARILAYKNTPSILKKQVSKFNQQNVGRERKFHPFWILFKFDNLNSKWSGRGGAVSLVAYATK